MSRGHPPDPDLYLISGEVEDLPAVETAEMLDGRLIVETANQAFYIIDFAGPHEQIEEIPEAADQVLITVQDGFLEFQEKDILLYELRENHDYKELLRQVLTGEAEPTELESEEASERLSQAGYVHGYTPQPIAEILTGWAITCLQSITSTASQSPPAASELA